MEIEHKYLIERDSLPAGFDTFPSKALKQGYLIHQPALRIRKETLLPDGESEYILTYKDKGGLARQEINITLPAEAGEKLFGKCDGYIIEKTRYLIPAGAKDTVSGRDLTIELDVFSGELKGLIYAEVEFDSVESANAYIQPEWFGKGVTGIKGYSNSDLSLFGMPANL